MLTEKHGPAEAENPGGILRTEFMDPLGITAYQLAKALHFPGIYEIVREQRAITGVPDQRRFCAGWGGSAPTSLSASENTLG